MGLGLLRLGWFYCKNIKKKVGKERFGCVDWRVSFGFRWALDVS